MLKQFTFLLLLSFIISVGFSQLDTLNKKLKIKENFALGGMFQEGNLDLFTIKSTSNTEIDYKVFNSVTYLQYIFNKTFKNTIQNDFFGCDIISIGKRKRFHPKFAGIYEKSKVKSIDNYIVFGFGIGWNAISNKKYKLEVMNTFSFEKKEFQIDKSVNYEGIRNSIIMIGKYSFFKNKMILSHKLFINPFFFNEENNYRYRVLVDLLLPLSKIFRLI